MDNSSPPSSFKELSFYSAHFMDQALWEPFVRRVATRYGFECQRILPGLPGTYPTFLVELGDQGNQNNQGAIVVKFFGPLFDGGGSFRAERAMGHFITQHSISIHTPAILADGQLTSDWCFLVFEHIPGVSIGQVRHELALDAMEGVAHQMGRFMKELHGLSATTRPIIPMGCARMSWDGYVDFLNAQRVNCFANHQHWYNLPPHLLTGLVDFIPPVEQLLDLASPAHLIHADLTADHLLGRVVPITQASAMQATEEPGAPAGMGWENLAIIDWGDCRAGNILYELVALHLDLFKTDKRLLRVCLEAYGLPTFYQQDFARKAFSMVLLHQFPMPTQIYVPHQDAHSLAELAERLFGL